MKNRNYPIESIDYDEVFKINIFKALEAACIAEGGDGDVMLCVEDYMSAADDFEKWLKEENNTWWKRDNGDTYVQFWNQQESIWFSNIEKNPHSYIHNVLKTNIFYSIMPQCN